MSGLWTEPITPDEFYLSITFSTPIERAKMAGLFKKTEVSEETAVSPDTIFMDAVSLLTINARDHRAMSSLYNEETFR